MEGIVKLFLLDVDLNLVVEVIVKVVVVFRGEKFFWVFVDFLMDGVEVGVVVNDNNKVNIYR